MYIQEHNLAIIPVDHVTDCMDLFELCTGQKGLSNDKNQRVVIMSIREDRLKGFLRRFMHFPTNVMLADALTKAGTFEQMLCFSDSGYFRIALKADAFVRCRIRKTTNMNSTEFDLVQMDQ